MVDSSRKYPGLIIISILAVLLSFQIIIKVMMLPSKSKIVIVSRKDAIIHDKIDINHASLDELCVLPGIGEKRAKDIIEYRRKYGLFSEIRDIELVPGIGPVRIKELAPWVEILP